MPFAKPFDGTVYHGSDKPIGEFVLTDPDRGIYFSGDAEYAHGYGPYVHACHVRLRNALAYTGEEAEGRMELEREALIAGGYDGRLVEYGNGEIDVIAFHPEQVTLVGMVSGPNASP